VKSRCTRVIGFAAEAVLFASVALLIVPVLVLAGLAYLERRVCRT
jgi:hypothetical protein